MLILKTRSQCDRFKVPELSMYTDHQWCILTCLISSKCTIVFQENLFRQDFPTLLTLPESTYVVVVLEPFEFTDSYPFVNVCNLTTIRHLWPSEVFGTQSRRIYTILPVL